MVVWALWLYYDYNIRLYIWLYYICLCINIALVHGVHPKSWCREISQWYPLKGTAYIKMSSLKTDNYYKSYSSIGVVWTRAFDLENKWITEKQM